jgi:hypothetical protein
VSKQAEQVSLHPLHAEKVSTALAHVDRGVEVLQTLLRLAAGKRVAGQQPLTQGDNPSPTTGPAAEQGGPFPIAQGRGKTLNIDGTIRVPLEAMRDFERWGEGMKAACAEVFGSILAVTKPLPPDSAAFSSAKDIVQACMVGAKEMLDREIAKAMASEWKSKGG